VPVAAPFVCVTIHPTFFLSGANFLFFALTCELLFALNRYKACVFGGFLYVMIAVMIV
jgi:hypothetical protein